MNETYVICACLIMGSLAMLMHQSADRNFRRMVSAELEEMKRRLERAGMLDDEA